MDKTKNRASQNGLLLLCAFVGAAAFLLTYGATPLIPTNDLWLLGGYDEGDINQHYAGWLAFRNSPWAFPLGYTSGLCAPDGVIISFTDSIPWVAVFFKLFRSFLPGTFQFFGIYTLLCFMLQGLAAGKLLQRFCTSQCYVLLGTVFFVFAPILLERAFRHTALGSQWLILFAMELYFQYSDSLCTEYEEYYCHSGRSRRKARFPWQFFLLNVLAIGIHPYFMPMTMMFTLLACIQRARYGLDMPWLCRMTSILFLAANLVVTVFAGWCLGAVGWAKTEAREGFGLYSMNLNAPLNPTSVFGYRWSRFLPSLPQNAGQYEGFNYFGLGFLLLLILALLIIVTKSKKEVLAEGLRKHIFLLAACILLMLFAMSNVFTVGTLSLEIPLPKWLLNLCGIFRASGRMFYPVWYLLLYAALFALWKRFGRQTACLAVVILLCVQLADLSCVILQKHSQMQAAADGSAAGEILHSTELLELGSTHTQLLLTGNITEDRRDLAILAAKQGMRCNAVIATGGGEYAGAWQSVMETAAAEAGSGNPDVNTVYVTNDAGFFEQWQRIYEDDGNIRLLAVGKEFFLIPNS